MLKQVGGGDYAKLNTWQSFVYMWRNEGFYGLFKGNGVSVARIAPFTALEFFFYDFFKNALFRDDKGQISNWGKLFCGGLTGMTASTLTYPTDLIRTKMSVSVGKYKVKPSIYGVGN